MTTNVPWYHSRHYIHFDLPLSEQAATNYVSDPDRIVHHAFYPFITYDLLTPRIKKISGAVKPFIKDPKHRPISYPAHKDGYIFSYYKRKLEDVYEEWLKEHGLGQAVTAFRATGENNVTLAKIAFDFVTRNPGCLIVATDVEKFFDTINHEQLKKTWSRFLGVPRLPDDHYAVYKAITRYSVVQRHMVYNLFGIPLSRRLNKAADPKRLCTPKQFREKIVRRTGPRTGLVEPNPGLGKGMGIPQGSPLSPLLSNMYMADLDLAMHTWMNSLGGAYWRYCDDILVVVPRGHRVPILRRLDQELRSLALRRSKRKTQRLNSRQLACLPLQYLGFTFDGSRTLVRSSSVHRYHRKLKKAIQAAEFRRDKETKASGSEAPLRQQALYNMYSELPTRGVKIKARKARQKHSGNFTHYMARSAKLLNSPSIERQRRKVLRKFHTSVRKHA